MVEPLDLGHHAAHRRLPHHLDAADVGPVRAARGQEHGAVVYVQDVLAPSAKSFHIKIIG